MIVQQVATKLILLTVPLIMSASVSSTTASSHNPLSHPHQDSSAGGNSKRDECQDEDKTLDKCPSKEDSECTDVPVASMSNAVVLYRPTALHAFREESKTFTFVNKELVIKQKWEDLGVAAVVWDAAVVLAEYIEKNSERFPLKGKSVVELGAGTGLVSMVAALLGASVIATDRKLALQFLHENIENNFPCTKTTNAENVQCNQDETITNPKGLNISVMELDWGKNHRDFSPAFDYILGADIVYIEETFEQLLETMLHLTSSERKSIILLSCRIRYDRDVRFLKMMKKHFMVKEINHDDKRGIKVFLAELKGKLSETTN